MAVNEYVCQGCKRTVDPDLEPSPSEPDRCADCHRSSGWDDAV